MNQTIDSKSQRTTMILFRLIFLSLFIILIVSYSCFSQEAEKVVPERLSFVAYEAFGIHFQNPLGVFYDSYHDEILVADTGNHRVVILDGKDGYEKSAFAHSVVSEGSNESTIGEPRSLAVNSLGDIFIVDNLCNYVDVCNYRGVHLTNIKLEDYIQQQSESSPLELKPVTVAVDHADNLYIATSHSIYVFNNKLEFQRQIGHKGTAFDEFSAISSLWVDEEGKIYVVDARGFGLRVLSPKGEVLLAFGGHDAGFNNFSMPVGVITDKKGHIWVADALRHIVSIFDKDGRFLDYIGAFGEEAGQFAFPSGLTANNNGKIVVLERMNERVQCFELSQEPERDCSASSKHITEPISSHPTSSETAPQSELPLAKADSENTNPDDQQVQAKDQKIDQAIISSPSPNIEWKKYEDPMPAELIKSNIDVKSEADATLPKTEQYYNIQVGSYSKKANAEFMAEQLTNKNYPVEIVPLNSNGKTLYRVMVGKFETKDEAQKMSQQLLKERYIDRKIIVSSR